jgi:hypothetical protein
MNLQNNTNSFSERKERRRNGRFPGVFPVQVRGVEANGKEFSTYTLADNLSAGGLYIQLPRPLEPGSQIEVVIRYSDQEPPVHFTAAGIVRRVETRAHGLYGIGVEFASFEFIQSSGSQEKSEAKS